MTWPAWWYCVLGAVVSLYQGWRGWHFQVRYGDSADLAAHPVAYRVSRCLADGLLYGISTAAGFAAWWLAYRVLVLVPVATMSGGVVTLLIFLVVLGGLGVTGHLPDVVLETKAIRDYVAKLLGVPHGS
jgi:hypothetical protein